MNFDTARRLVFASRRVAPGFGVRPFHNRYKFLLAAWRSRNTIEPMLNVESCSDLGRLLEERPEMLGVLIWPYQAANFGASERLARIITHCEIVDSLGAPFKFSVDEKLALLNLDSIFPGLRIVLDQPRWFMREGQFTLNIFLDDFRAFSLVFSFFRHENNEPEAIIGAMQGRNRENILDTYRRLTKALYGLRPRDFLLETFRMLCRAIGVSRIYGVSSASSIRRHAYFGKAAGVRLDYDEIWRDRGGRPVNDIFYEIDRDPPARDLSSVKPNKRSMYRKRDEFLKNTEETLRAELPGLQPVRFKDI